ncbi:MAG: apolipoprotein N-acyltransferase [Proteobacteria bacterium]|nr:apolipoprotein N-acyltransferase [Pseudomonadota bacterium]
MTRRREETAIMEAVEEIIEQPEGEQSAPAEKQLLTNLLSTRGRTVADIMTPRADIFAVEENTDLRKLAALMAHSGHSRVPVYRRTLDDVLGFVHIKDITAALVDEKPVALKDIVRKLLFVSPSMAVTKLLLQMRQRRRHMALVVDEFGGIDGLLTIEDVVETIVGEIDDEYDDPELTAPLQRRSDGSVLVDARMPLEAFEEQVGAFLQEQERSEMDTLGGLTFALAGRVPSRGEVLRHSSGVSFEVVDADTRRVKRLWLCFAGGGLGALALAPVSWPVFFFPGFILAVFYLRDSKSLKQSFLLAFFYALGFHIAGLYWISASLFVDITRYFWVLPLSLAALPCWLALLFGLGAMAAHPLRRKPVTHAVFLSCTIFFSEFVRGFLFTGFPWNLFGNIWDEVLPLAQSVSLFGIYGLTFFTLLAATASSLLLAPVKRGGLVLIVVSWTLLSSLALWGEVRLQTHATAYDEKITLRIVQPGITQEERRTREQRIAALSRLVHLSSQKTENQPTHLLWPETAVPDFLAADPELRRSLARIVPKGGALLTGTPGEKFQGREIFYSNSLAVLSDQAAIIGLYDKHHLVPFGEFVPFRRFLKVMPVAVDVIGERADFSGGPGPRTLRAPNFPPFSPLICYEAIFSGGVIDRADPPALLLQVTNDAWFGMTSGPYQHFAQARLRAIEEGLPLVRAANTGISGMIDPLGRKVISLALGKAGFLDVHLPLPLAGATIFSRFGNTPILALTLLLSLLIVVNLYRKSN